MKTFLLVLLCAACASALVLHEDEFKQWMKEYKVDGYASDLDYQTRLKIFSRNVENFKVLNKQGGGAEFGLGPFTDLTHAEFQARYLMQPQDPKVLARACLKGGVYRPAPRVVDPPPSFDWRSTPGIVQAVRDQGSCGSCWAFSTAQNIEGQLGLQGAKGLEMSPQYLVDCSDGCSSETINGKNTTVCNSGCEGGWPWTAFSDIVSKHGIPQESDYPYKGVTGTCKGNNGTVVAKLTNYTCITPAVGDLDEKTLAAQLVELGPLSIGVNADPFQSYKKGILDPLFGCSKNPLNHAVLLVGYGTENGKDFWIIKNSWGPKWGEEGYVRMIRGKNECGVTEAVSCAILS